MDTIRAHAARNRDVYQTVLASSLSLMAIVVSVASYSVAASQTRYSQSSATAALSQAALAEAQTQPDFRITYGYSKTPKDFEDSPEQYTLENVGYHAANVTVDTIGFLRVWDLDESGEPTRTALIPFDRYLGHPVQASGGKSTYTRVTDPANDVELENAIAELSGDDSSLSITPCVFFDISYQDIFGKPRRMMYFADENNSFRVGDEDAAHIRAYATRMWSAEEWYRRGVNGDPERVLAWWKQEWPKSELRFLAENTPFGERFP